MTETTSPSADDAARPTLAFIGAGRAAAVLATAARAAHYPVVAVASRRRGAAEQLAALVDADVTTAIVAARRADICFLTVPDGAITRVAATVAASGMPLRGRIMVHCAASLPRSVLSAARQQGAAVAGLHPLQALAGAASGARLVGSHFGLDADPRAVPALERLVTDLGGRVLALDGIDRRLYHAAAVLAGNAPLALLARAAGLLTDAGLETGVAEEALATLLEGAAANVRRLGVRAALTGPVARRDVATVEGHLGALASHPAARDLYVRLALEMVDLGDPGVQSEALRTVLGGAAAPATAPPLRLHARSRRLDAGAA